MRIDVDTLEIKAQLMCIYDHDVSQDVGYTTLNIHEIWLRLLLGEHLLYIRAKMTSFVNSLD